MRIPQFEPLMVPLAALDSGSHFNARFENIAVTGMTRFKLKNFDVEVDTDTVNIGLFFDKLSGLSDYKIKGKILFLEVDGGGRANITFSKNQLQQIFSLNHKRFVGDIDTSAILRGHRKKAKGKEYVIFDQIDLELKIEGGHMYFSDIFKDNAELTNNTNKVINENLLVVMEELYPVIKSAIRQLILGLVSQLFEKFSIDELFIIED